MKKAHANLVALATSKGCTVAQSGEHLIVAKNSRRSITIFADGVILRNDVAAELQSRISVATATAFLKI